MSAIVAEGFRNLAGRIPLSDPLAVLIGENNVGKSSVIEACRLLFTAEAGRHAQRWPVPEDFSHDGAGTPVANTFQLSAELDGLDVAERARLVTCLAPSLGPDAARIRLHARLRPDGRIDSTWYGGDSTVPDIDPWARESLTCTYLHPLRDAAADLRPGRDNRLVALLRTLAPEGHADRAAVEALVTQLNAQLVQIGAVSTAKTGIQTQLDQLVDHGPFRQQTDLAFSDPRFDRVVGTLRALAGHLHPLEIVENGLGYNNLLYMAVLLAALTTAPDPASLRLLLVEEPEAHLHPQLQDLLMRYLEQKGNANTQVIVTSHSPNFASAARVQRITVLTGAPGAPSTAHMPAGFGLPDGQLDHLHRFLDVTKAALLFARGVILVEGVAEQLLLPVFARLLKRPLSRSGINVINTGGLAFAPFADLFTDGRLPYRCAIVTDADPPTDKDNEQPPTGEELVVSDRAVPEGPHAHAKQVDSEDHATGDPPPVTSATARKLVGTYTASGNVDVFLATRTLEWDLAHTTGNWQTLLNALRPVHPTLAKRLAGEHMNSSSDQQADGFLAAVGRDKADVAQQLAALLDTDAPPPFVVPDYLRRAIEWVTTEPASTPAAGQNEDGDERPAP